MPSEQITIAGATFSVPLRYEEGHELTAGEASALNQTYHENIRNNLAKKAKEGSLTQADVDAYASEYQFGVRAAGTGTRTSDPAMSEALRIAKDQLKAKLKAAGKSLNDYEASAITTAAKELIERDPAILELAKQRVAEQQSLAATDIGDLLAGLTEKPAKIEEPAPVAEPQA
jgi:hypothetical protein